MYKKILLAFSVSVVANIASAGIENKYQAEVSHAQELGNLLYKKVKSKDAFKLKSLENYKEVKLHLKKAGCGEFSYKASIVKDKDSELLYFVASKKFSSPVIIGRYFVAPIENGALNLEKIISSTRGCLNLGSPKKATKGMFATSLDPYPSEFHVLQSKLHGVTLYLGTEYAIWKIVNGQVSLMKLRNEA